jgi:hypothetical protein
MSDDVRENPEPVFVRSPGIDSQPDRLDFLKSIPGLLKRLQIRALDYFTMIIDKQEGIEGPRLKSSFQKGNECQLQKRVGGG